MKFLFAYRAPAVLAVAAGVVAFYSIPAGYLRMGVSPPPPDDIDLLVTVAGASAKTAADKASAGAEAAHVTPTLLSSESSAQVAEPPAVAVAATIATVNATKTVYTCGWDNGNLHRHLFPDYRDMGRLDAEPRPDPPSADSVFVLGGGGHCSGINAMELMKETGGSVLRVNGDGGRMFSAVPPSKVKVRGYFGPSVLMNLFSSEHWDAIFEPEKKPINTRERYLMYLVDNCLEFREKAFDALSRNGTTAAYYGGKCKGFDRHKLKRKAPKREVTPRNSPGTTVPWRDNYKIFSRYRFCLVMENKNWQGYITEKIMNAFLGGCIPIYHGTEEVYDIFNQQAFIYYDPVFPKPALARVAYLEQNTTAYEEMLREPILANGNRTIKEYFSYADSVGGGVLKGRIRQMLGIPA